MNDCRHERGHITDSKFYGDRYATPASRRIFCDICRFARWLEIEAALALSQAELGMIPRAAAEQIAATASVENLDLDAVKRETDRSGHSLVGLLRVFQSACPADSGEYIHHGATTQDIQDTGQVLEVREVLDELEPLLRSLISSAHELAAQHAHTVAVGRTHAQPALPIAFGLKVASWLDELLRHGERLREIRPRILVAQLAGGAGTMAGFGTAGPELLERFASRLGLTAPRVGWHVARDRVVEYAVTLAMIAGTASRIAEEIRVLSRPEFGEVSEPWSHGKVGSSTMPHKRNPERCEQVTVMAKLAAAQVGLALSAMAGDHERDSRTLRVEWACVPDVAHYTLAACTILNETLSGLTIHVDRCRTNVQHTADKIASERLMLALGDKLGKQTAHEVVYDLSQKAHESGVALRSLVAEQEDLSTLLSEADLAEIFDPSRYLGASTELTIRMVEEARAWLANGADR